MDGAILVPGGAGYIGSHTVLALRERGHDVLVLDDFSEGHRGAVRGAGVGEDGVCAGSLLDPAFLDQVFDRHAIVGVVHFAARCYVGESVRDPGLYYRNNVGGTLNLLQAMARAEVRHLVFSSTCATYGVPDDLPITEDAEQRPVNPYGHSKLMCEQMFRDFGAAWGLASAALRYFNAAGADPGGRLGEDHDPETHLVPLVLESAHGGPTLEIFGDDYDTPDGTCIRDYVHVTDLAQAHVLAVEALVAGELTDFTAFNLGNGRGVSVREVLAAAEGVTGKPVPHRVAPRRPGDPPVLVGSSARIEEQLGWSPRFGAIEEIVATADRWHREHPEGFGAD